MSIYDTDVAGDVLAIFADVYGFAETHNVDGTSMPAIVHSSQISSKTSLMDLSVFGSDISVIVKASDMTNGMPECGAIFFLDEVEYRVANASMLGGRCAIKVQLNRVET